MSFLGGLVGRVRGMFGLFMDLGIFPSVWSSQVGTFLAVDGLGLPIESSSYERGPPNVWGCCPWKGVPEPSSECLGIVPIEGGP